MKKDHALYNAEETEWVLLDNCCPGVNQILFLGIEIRGYQYYYIYPARIRMIQENLFANALDTSTGVEHHDWRREFSDDHPRR